MASYRRITPVNLKEQKKLIQERKLVQNKNTKTKITDSKIIKEQKEPEKTVENTGVQNMLLRTCSNLRGVCNTLRKFTDDFDNLLNSVEAMIPVLNSALSGYTRLQQENNNTFEAESEANTKDSTSQNKDTNENNNSKPPPRVPSEADFKEFLNNPLVQSVIKNLVQKNTQ